jgi:hypothetical protein
MSLSSIIAQVIERIGNVVFRDGLDVHHHPHDGSMMVDGWILFSQQNQEWLVTVFPLGPSKVVYRHKDWQSCIHVIMALVMRHRTAQGLAMIDAGD